MVGSIITFYFVKKTHVKLFCISQPFQIIVVPAHAKANVRRAGLKLEFWINTNHVEWAIRNQYFVH